MSALHQPLVDQPLYTPADLAAKLGVSVRTLNDWRLDGRGPRFLKVGHRTVKYAASDVEQWLQSLRQELNSDERSNEKNAPRAGTRRPMALPIPFPGPLLLGSHRITRRRLKSERGRSDRG